MTKNKKPGRNILPGLTILLLIIAVEFYLPALVTEQLTRALALNFHSAKEFNIKHKTIPAAKLLFGQMENLVIEGSQIEAKPYKVDVFYLDARSARISLTDLLLRGRFTLKKAKGRLAFSFEEKELDNYLHRFYIDDPYNELQLRLTEEGPRIEGKIDGIMIYLDAMFAVEKNSIICLNPRKMVSTSSNTQKVMDKLKELSIFSLDLSVLGIPLIIDEVLIKDSSLYVFATIGS